MYIDLPHRGERVKTVHNVKQYDTHEDMGRSMPRIYEVLDNKKHEFQFHMIEV
jgi:hypothetical protein